MMNRFSIFSTSKRCRLATVMLVFCLFSLFSCKSDVNVNDPSEFRPRRDLPPEITRPRERKPLVGLFVDPKSKALNPDGKSWKTAFTTPMQAVNVSSGQKIYLAAGTHAHPHIDLRDRENVHFVGGYSVNDLYEKDTLAPGPQDWVIFDGGGIAESLVIIGGAAQSISFIGGFVFKNVQGAPALVIEGDSANAPVKEVTFAEIRFENNNNNGLQDGGGLRLKWATGVRLTNVSARKNISRDFGGYLYAEEITNLTILNGVIENNEVVNLATGSGGAMYLKNVRRLRLGGQVFSENIAGEGGGIYFEGLTREQIADIKFSFNQARGVGGGAISVKDSREVTISGMNFSNNQSTNGLGGAVHAKNVNDLNMQFGDSFVTKNRAKNGGAVAIDECQKISLKGGKFTTNSAENGGSIYVAKPEVSVDVDGASFDTNKATHMGGAIFLTNAGAVLPQVNIAHSTFVGNEATGNGGAIATMNISYLVSISALFDANKSENYGGALALDAKSDPRARFVIESGSKFIGNRSEKNYGGGAIFAVFDLALAGPLAVLPQPNQRQLVFLNELSDVDNNNVAGNGLYGQILRITDHDIASTSTTVPPAPLVNPAPPPAAFLTEINPPANMNKKLKFFVAYSTDAADNAAPWNRLRLGWESSVREVYSW